MYVHYSKRRRGLGAVDPSGLVDTSSIPVGSDPVSADDLNAAIAALPLDAPGPAALNSAVSLTPMSPPNWFVLAAVAGGVILFSGMLKGSR